MNKVERTGFFIAKRSDNGANVRVNIFTEFADCSTRAGSSWEAVSTALKLDDGSHVNPVTKGHYQIMFPKVDLFTDDPNAP
ncbi:MAG: hypothetical protein WAU84_13215 [Thermoguttaceae bacterium]|jgi:hypothetical protein